MGSHICFTLPPGGLSRRVPFTYLAMTGISPRGMPFIDIKQDRHDLVVFMALWPTPVLKYSIRNCMHWFIFGVMGCIPCTLVNNNHLLATHS